MTTYKEVLQERNAREDATALAEFTGDSPLKAPNLPGETGANCRFFSLSAISDAWLETLTEKDAAYGHWFRIILLRANLFAMTSRMGITWCHSELGPSLARIGFVSPRQFLDAHGEDQALQALHTILAAWEQELDQPCVFPPVLGRNLRAVAEVVGLDDVELQLLGLGILIHTEQALRVTLEALGDASAIVVPRIMAYLSGYPLELVQRALGDQGALSRSGLLTLDFATTGAFHLLVDLLSPGFGQIMVSVDTGSEQILRAHMAQVDEGKLADADFAHIADSLSLIREHLSLALRARSAGVNILLYGVPGTGKSQFARLVARSLGVKMIEVVAADQRGDPISPLRRLKSYRLGQEMFRRGNGLILFDECEEVLNGDGFMDTEPGLASGARKSWVNLMLEKNMVPAIWIANSIDAFDPAYIRRFDVCLKMPLPPASQRRELFVRSGGNEIDDRVLDLLARHSHTSPAMVGRTAEIVQLVAPEKSKEERSRLTLQLVNHKLVAIGQSEISMGGGPAISFNPAYVNTTADIQHLQHGLDKGRQGRLCLYGPPGTGKTAFGRWLADSLSVPHLLFKASDLLGKYVGETEKQIAGAFAAARREGAVLQFDEVDGFLQERSGESRSWEVRMVNEMLTQMDAFEGIFVASTNLFEDLDEAALRRFDLSLKFDFLRPAAAASLLCDVCQTLKLAEPTPEQMRALSCLPSLTPGDFLQALRQDRLLPIASVQDLLSRLSRAVAVKKSSEVSKIGFLRAA